MNSLTIPSGRPLVTAKEIAARLQVTSRWVYEQVDRHGMPAYRLGERALRFDPDAVQVWLEARRVGDWSGARSCGRPISRVPL